MSVSIKIADQILETDRYLIDRILKEKDRDAAEKLIGRYYKRVYKEIYIRTNDEELAKDLVQETFVSVLHSLYQYDSTKSSFKVWLTKIAANKVIDNSRSRYFHEKEKTVSIEGIDRTDFKEAESTAINNTIMELVIEKLKDKDVKDRNIFWMKTHEGYTFNEIAELMGISESTVKSKYYSMTKKLRKELGDYEQNQISG